MSIAQTYFLAHKARAKLSSEAARPDHNLRLLVGHANLLDSLMLELADAEREQESWFNQSVRGASHTTSTSPVSVTPSQDRHIQWADTIVEEPEHDWHAEDAESDSDSSDSDSDFDDEEDIEMADAVALRRIPSHALLPKMSYTKYDDEVEEDDYDMDDEEDFAQLALQRSPSHSASSSSASLSPSSPPELDDDSDSDSTEDESMPPSPPTTLIPAFETPQQQKGSNNSTATATETTTDAEDKTAFYEDGYYLPPRNPARLISAISVY